MTFLSGYMSPEYAKHGQYSIKSDVFSFGVLILEIVSLKVSIPINWLINPRTFM